MNKFDELKAKILKQYPKTPLLVRCLSPFLPTRHHIISETIDRTYYRQSAILVIYKNKEYLLKFAHKD